MTEISKEYGTALFMLACERDKKKEYSVALETVKAALLESSDYLEFLSSPSVSLKERLSSLKEVFSGKIPEDVLSYIQLICEKGRMKCFEESVEAYKLLLAESERVVKAKITSVIALSDEEKEKLRIKLEETYKQKVEIEYFTDASLMGGIVMEVDGKVSDGSLKSRLRDIKEVISK